STCVVLTRVAAGFVPFFACTKLKSFFFSSRRRHTISKRDWSSDVCSSDLFADDAADFVVGRFGKSLFVKWRGASQQFVEQYAQRSEERRVGKERRALCWPRLGKKKEIMTWNRRVVGVVGAGMIWVGWSGIS